MICFSCGFLRDIGATEALIKGMQEGSYEGLCASEIFSFGGGGNRGRDIAALEQEQAASGQPGELFLVGMEDRYGEAKQRKAGVLTLCVSDTTLTHRMPLAHEKAVLLEALARMEAMGRGSGGVIMLVDLLSAIKTITM